MNKLKGQISEVKVQGSLSQVTVSLGDATTIQSIVIETPDTAAYLREGNPINIIFKETEVILSLMDDIPISLVNRIKGSITDIKTGELLCEITVETAAGALTSIISRDAFELLGLKSGDPVTALVKQNEVMLSE